MFVVKRECRSSREWKLEGKALLKEKRKVRGVKKRLCFVGFGMSYKGYGRLHTTDAQGKRRFRPWLYRDRA
jgi:hypothetical protein